MNATLVLPSGTFTLDIDESMTLLDALEILKAGPDRGLRYRHSCHHGSCGTCGAMVNGKPVLMCLTRLAPLAGEPVRIEALRGMRRIGDLAVHPGSFFDTLPDTGYLRSSDLPHASPKPEGGRWERFEACIECGICVSACPVEEDFDGPAALAAADREREERPERQGEMLDFAAGARGVAACMSRFACSAACPQSVAPGRRIVALRKSLATREMDGD